MASCLNADVSKLCVIIKNGVSKINSSKKNTLINGKHEKQFTVTAKILEVTSVAFRSDFCDNRDRGI